MENNFKEYKGKIEIQGKISLDQFYTLGGESDAETVKINLTIDTVDFERIKIWNGRIILEYFLMH